MIFSKKVIFTGMEDASYEKDSKAVKAVRLKFEDESMTSIDFFVKLGLDQDIDNLTPAEMRVDGKRNDEGTLYIDCDTKSRFNGITFKCFKKIESGN